MLIPGIKPSKIITSIVLSRRAFCLWITAVGLEHAAKLFVSCHRSEPGVSGKSSWLC